MKYLKSFNENTNIEYPKAEQNDFHYSDPDVFTEKEIEEIINFTNSKKLKYIFNNVDTTDQYFTVNLTGDGRRVNIEYPGVSIVKSTDEWFYIAIATSHTISNYYKCDQLHGLISCLSDNIVANK